VRHEKLAGENLPPHQVLHRPYPRHSVRFQLPDPLFQAFAVFDVVVARGVFVVGFGLAGARTSVRSNVRVYCGLGKVRDAGGFRVLLRTEVRAPVECVILTSEP